MLVFFFLFCASHCYILLETALFEDLGQDVVDGVDNEADALEGMTLQDMFWLVGLGRGLGPACQESWYLCFNRRQCSPPCGWSQPGPPREARVTWGVGLGFEGA